MGQFDRFSDAVWASDFQKFQSVYDPGKEYKFDESGFPLLPDGSMEIRFIKCAAYSSDLTMILPMSRRCTPFGHFAELIKKSMIVRLKELFKKSHLE